MGVRKVVEVTKKVLMLLTMLTLLLASALPIDTSAALAQEELAQEIVVTGWSAMRVLRPMVRPSTA
jgi:hypothetical protein